MTNCTKLLLESAAIQGIQV